MFEGVHGKIGHPKTFISQAYGPILTAMIEHVTELVHEVASGIIGPHAVLPGWALAAWLIVIFAGILVPGIQAKLSTPEEKS